jgi:hypothetical protein
MARVFGSSPLSLPLWKQAIHSRETEKKRKIRSTFKIASPDV